MFYDTEPKEDLTHNKSPYAHYEVANKIRKRIEKHRSEMTASERRKYLKIAKEIIKRGKELEARNPLI